MFPCHFLGVPQHSGIVFHALLTAVEQIRYITLPYTAIALLVREFLEARAKLQTKRPDKVKKGEGSGDEYKQTERAPVEAL
jgi:hypothetical protein